MPEKKTKITEQDVRKIAMLVLSDAVENIFCFEDKNRNEDLMWLFSDEIVHPMSYLNICDFLRINNPNKLRKIVVSFESNDKYKTDDFKRNIKKAIKVIYKEVES